VQQIKKEVQKNVNTIRKCYWWYLVSKGGLMMRWLGSLDGDNEVVFYYLSPSGGI
jgi:hypothetical protein